MPEATRVVLDSCYPIAPLDRRLFGSFVEHMGRCVYTGIYEPGHASADANGFRTDVLDLVRELGVSMVRYPGGNFVSSYRWEDGVGPRAQRPVRPDAAWKSIETNQFGLDEFMAWAERADVEPMLAVNLGTRGVAEALDLLEYCNLPTGTHYADQRATNGHPAPYDVRLWCVGNEMDGPWQVGQQTADEYGRLALRTARAMRRMDPNLQLVACGSSDTSLPTFGSWEATVLQHCYDAVDYISLHGYYEQHGTDQDSYLASGVGMDRFIEAVTAIADYVRAAGRHDKQLQLSFDEWNVRGLNAHTENLAGDAGTDWEIAPPIGQDDYRAIDAGVFGSLLISLLNHADRVPVACLAQLVNVLGPIRAEPNGPAWRQSIFHPFAATARHAQGTVLRPAISGPVVSTAEYGTVAMVDAAATVADDRTALFVVNRSATAAAEIEVVRQNLPAADQVCARVLRAPALTTLNTAADPDAVTLAEARVSATSTGFTLTLPPAAWGVVTTSRI